jgi:hypothetical protein
LDHPVKPEKIRTNRRVGKAKRAHLSLSERPDKLLEISAPIGGKQPTFDEAMKAAVRPVRYHG